MNQQVLARPKAWRTVREIACAPQSAGTVRFRGPRPRTILVQFVAHAPEVLPVRVISFR